MLAVALAMTRLRPGMQTWIITARSPSGEELPIGLAEASNESAALARGRSKAASLLRRGAGYEIIVRPASAG